MTWDARKKHIEARRRAAPVHDDAELERLTAPPTKQGAPSVATDPTPPPASTTPPATKPADKSKPSGK